MNLSDPDPTARTSVPNACVPMAEVEDVLDRRGLCIVDLRSPSEFAEDHLPGAVNVPLFDDAGRALVGMLYSKASPEQAFDQGRRLTLARVHELVDGIARAADWRPPVGRSLEHEVEAVCEGGIERLEEQLQGRPVRVPPSGRPLVLHCWRGGLRSRSVVHLLHRLGLERAVGLRGGYKAYRRLVMARLADYTAPPTYVLRGLTGVGKTLVLRRLEELRPGLTLDLEGAAGHRSSLLGMVGLEPCSQKRFDSRIAERLAQLPPHLPLVLEGESRKVGDVIVPPRLWEALDGGTGIELVASTRRRVEVLMDDYLARPEALPLLHRQLEAVAARMGRRGQDLRDLKAAERWPDLVELLLEHYYDPLYRHGERGRSYALTVDADDPDRAAHEILAWIDARS